jgi:hypothetical protein
MGIRHAGERSKLARKRTALTQRQTAPCQEQDHREPPRQKKSPFYRITGMFKGQGKVLALGTPRSEVLDGQSAPERSRSVGAAWVEREPAREVVISREHYKTYGASQTRGGLIYQRRYLL